MVIVLEAPGKTEAIQVRMACLLAGVEYNEFHEPDEQRYVFEVYGDPSKCEYIAARSGATIVDYLESVPR